VCELCLLKKEKKKRGPKNERSIPTRHEYPTNLSKREEKGEEKKKKKRGETFFLFLGEPKTHFSYWEERKPKGKTPEVNGAYCMFTIGGKLQRKSHIFSSVEGGKKKQKEKGGVADIIMTTK